MKFFNVDNYFLCSWYIEFKTMTDIDTLANILYIGYGHALLIYPIKYWYFYTHFWGKGNNQEYPWLFI